MQWYICFPCSLGDLIDDYNGLSQLECKEEQSLLQWCQFRGRCNLLFFQGKKEKKEKIYIYCYISALVWPLCSLCADLKCAGLASLERRRIFSCSWEKPLCRMDFWKYLTSLALFVAGKWRIDRATGKKWQSSTTINGTRKNLMQLGPKLSRVVLAKSNQEQRTGKIHVKNYFKASRIEICIYCIILLHRYIADIITNQLKEH